MTTTAVMKHQHELNERLQLKYVNVFTLHEFPHVVVVCLNRPLKRNAINSKMWKEIGEVFLSIGTTGDGSRCILLMGAGKGFCAGIDVSDSNFGLSTVDEDVNEENDIARQYLSFRPKILEMQRAFTAVEECPLPVVACLHGSCIGAGVDLACCADIRLCSSSTRFSVREVRLGLAADVGTLQRLPKIVGHGSYVRELCFTGQDFHAIDAEKIGFVSRVYQSENELFGMSKKLCREIAKYSPVAVSGTKSSLNYSRDHSVREGLEHIATQNAAALMTDDLTRSFLAVSSGQRDQVADFSNMLPHAKL